MRHLFGKKPREPRQASDLTRIRDDFATTLVKKPNGLIGGRMYKSIDGKSAVLVSQFESGSAQEDIRQSDAFKQHVNQLQVLIESASPSLYEEAYTTGDFK